MRSIMFISAAMLISLSQGVFAQAQNRDQVKRGERPPIFLERVNKDSYYPNIIRVKISAKFEEKLLSLPDKSKEFVPIGITSVDDLNAKYSVNTISRTFPETILKRKFADRQKAWGFHLWYEFEMKENQNIVELVRAYSALSEVEIAEPVFKKQIVDYNPDGFFHVAENINIDKDTEKTDKWTPNDPRFNEQWHYYNTGQQSGTPGIDIDLISAWEMQKGNPDVIVAIIDGGIDHNHPDIQASMWSGIGYNLVSNTTTIEPHNHGTHVAGTVAAVNNNGIGVSGIAGGETGGNGVRLMSCQVFTASSSGGFAAAPVYAAENGAVISQNSWGYTSAGVYEQAVLDAIDYFNQNAGSELTSSLSGGITIFAAGNSYSSGEWYPGYYSGAMAVAATNNQDVKAWYSNYDSWVEISAPGGETNTVNARGVLSTVNNNGYAFYQGTSMACPHVSGVAALVVSHIPGELTANELREMLKETTDNHYSQNPSHIGMLGVGRLNAYKALVDAEGFATGLKNPGNFTAQELSAESIELSWTLNDNSNSVMLAYNTEAKFGIPESSFQIGDLISGGGEVIYVGDNLEFLHLDLEGSTSYYYRIWSFTDEGGVSSGRGAFATTLCSIFELPFSEDLSGMQFPHCWETQWEGSGTPNIWSVSNSNKAGGVAGEFHGRYVSNTGTSRLITPPFNTLGLSNAILTFNHFFDDYSAGLTLKVETSTDRENWVSTDWSLSSGGGDFGPQEIAVEINNSLNSQTTYIAFSIVGNHFNFDNWYIDNIAINGLPTGSPIVETSDAINIGETTVSLNGSIVSQGDQNVTASGFLVSLNPNPQIDSPNTTIYSTNPLVQEGGFGVSISNLNPATTYYFRAFATNSIATSYGSSVQFTTLCGTIQLPYVQNFTSSSLPSCWENQNNGGTAGQIWTFGSFSDGLSGSDSYAYINSDSYGQGNNQNANLVTPPINVTDYDEVTLQFNHYFRQYQSASTVVVSYSFNNGVTWNFLQNWTETTPNPAVFEQSIVVEEGQTEIMFRWNFTGNWAYYWCVDDVEVSGIFSGEPPVVLTVAATDITSSSATLNATVNPNNKVTSAFFEWGINNVAENETIVHTDLSGVDDVDVFFNPLGLLPGKDYLFRAKASSLAGMVMGDVLTFTTIDDKPVSSQLNVEELSSRDATLSGTILSNGGHAILQAGVYVSETPEPTTGDLFLEIDKVEGLFSINVPNLMPNTQYFARIFLENALGQSFSEDLEFTTDIEAPVVNTLLTEDYQSDQALLEGQLVTSWSGMVDNLGFVIHINDNPFIDTPDARVLFVDGMVDEGSGFSLLADNLTQNTTYYYKAFAENIAGIGYGQIHSFTTTALNSPDLTSRKTIVFPNPFSSFVNIQSDSVIDRVVLSTITGKQVFTKNVGNKSAEVDLQFLHNGIYIVCIYYSNGSTSYSKLIKQ